MGDYIELGDDNGPSPDEYAAMLADMEMEARCPAMNDADIDAMASGFGL